MCYSRSKTLSPSSNAFSSHCKEMVGIKNTPKQPSLHTAHAHRHGSHVQHSARISRAKTFRFPVSANETVNISASSLQSLLAQRRLHVPCFYSVEKYVEMVFFGGNTLAKISPTFIVKLVIPTGEADRAIVCRPKCHKSVTLRIERTHSTR